MATPMVGIDLLTKSSMGVLIDPGDIIGFTRDGRAIRLPGGGARNTYEDWIPEEWEGPVITRVNQVSAIEAWARRVPMSTDTKHTPRSAGVGVAAVAKGGTYTEDESVNDEILLTARKIGKAIRIADEDLKDTAQVANIVATKQNDWATSYAKFMDNATLGCSGTENGTTIPFTSVYKALRTTNADTSYTADANHLSSSTITYANLSEVFGYVEDSDYFDESMMGVMASPAYKKLVRDIVDEQSRPIFSEGRGSDPDTLFGYPIRWSRGCRVSATATDAPAGNPLLFVGNRDYLVLGVRSGPETRQAGADTGVGFLTDEAILKMRSRRGFAVGHESAFAVLENTA